VQKKIFSCLKRLKDFYEIKQRGFIKISPLEFEAEPKNLVDSPALARCLLLQSG
jgi:hypothetical protein